MRDIGLKKEKRNNLVDDRENGKRKRGQKSKMVIFAIIAIAMVLSVLTVGVGICNSPAYRMQHQLDLGNRYLEELDYERAAVAFEQAIAIDGQCIAAYEGGIQAYAQMGDQETLQEFYNRALAGMEDQDQDFQEQNMDAMVQIYMMAENVYGNEPEQAAEILEKGWDVTSEPALKDKMAEIYLAMAEKEYESRQYEEALAIYDKCRELMGEEDSFLEFLEKVLADYMELLLDEKRYREMIALEEKYGTITVNVDYSKYWQAMAAKDTWADAEEESDGAYSDGNTAWVDELYQKMVDGDVNAVFEIMKEDDFIENCNLYPHRDVVWSTDYTLFASGGEVITVVKSIDSDNVIVVHSPSDPFTQAADVCAGDYAYETAGGNGVFWMVGTNVVYYSDGRTYTLEENDIWEVFHM